MNFDATIPFDIPRAMLEAGVDAADRTAARSDFWAFVEEKYEGLGAAIGCYVFSMSSRKSPKPWYVGMTRAKAGFKSEVFLPHKINHYQDVLALTSRAKPQMSFFPLCTPDNWRLSKAATAGEASIRWLEETLIGMAVAQNPEIRNVSGTMFHKNVYVHGLIGAQDQGRPDNGAAFARKLFLG